MTEYHVAWWNLENLFDVKDAYELSRRPEWLQEELRGGYTDELAGWDEEVLGAKIEQLASVIERMNGGRGPDLLGVCEVENRYVLGQLVEAIELPDREYGVAHHDSDDGRGIDVAFLYDRDRFAHGETFDRVIRKRNATRDLVQVNFETAGGNRLIVVGNHWPARSGGQWPSEPYRMMAGETLGYWMERIPPNVGDPEVAVLAMGDFNDEPHNRSLTEYAGAVRNETKLRYRDHAMLNLSWAHLGDQATYFYDGRPLVLDQFIASASLVDGEGPLSVDRESLEVVQFDDMIEDRGYPAPIRFGRPGDGEEFDPTVGYSDHLPIEMLLEESS